MVHHLNHLPNQTRPVSAPNPKADILQLVSAENEGVLWHAFEDNLSASYSWICHQEWRLRSLKVQFNHLSMGCGHGRLKDCEEYLSGSGGGSPRMWFWWWGTLTLPQLTLVQSASAPRIGMSTPGSQLPCRRVFPQLLGHLYSSRYTPKETKSMIATSHESILCLGRWV